MLSRPRAVRLLAVVVRSAPPRRWLQTGATSKTSEPLRILFCGSDAFSCESLSALHREHVQNPGLVKSLDVMVRPPKRTGRGLKQLRQVPCEILAGELGLTTHQRDTFREWQLPDGINLIVAVSFGLFVPPRILGASKYGGLNVHPSFLPDLRGPAPIHWSLLRGDKHVGVSLQTLDAKSFDHGTILAQTPAPGIPVPPRCSLPELTKMLGMQGAEMLVQGLRDGVHVPPLKDAGWKAKAMGDDAPLTHAPKVTKADAQVDWMAWPAAEFERRVCALGPMWSHARNNKAVVKRVLLQDSEAAAPAETLGSGDTITFMDGTGANECTRRIVVDTETGCCHLETQDGSWIRVMRVKVDGKPEQPAATALRPFLQRAAEVETV